MEWSEGGGKWDNCNSIINKYIYFKSGEKKPWYIYTMEYYSAIKKKQILPFAIAWMDLAGIMLNEIS